MKESSSLMTVARQGSSELKFYAEESTRNMELGMIHIGMLLGMEEVLDRAVLLGKLGASMSFIGSGSSFMWPPVAHLGGSFRRLDIEDSCSETA